MRRLDDLEQLEAVESAHAGAVDAAVVVRALALLDQGRTDEARELLAAALSSGDAGVFAPAGEGAFDRGRDSGGFGRTAEVGGFGRTPEVGGFGRTPEVGGFGRLGDAELESAFDDARPETDAMIDADGIAFEAIRRARLDEPEIAPLPAPDSPFHTRTLADLLERQGDAESADAIRSALAVGASESSAPRALDGEARARTIQTLERWLARLRGGDA
jgi:hypothetical protein